MIDLKLFCEPDDYRVCEPWRVGAHVYATDKKIIIRAAADEYPDVRTRDGIAPKDGHITELLWNHATLNNWQEIPSELPEPIVTECEECKGEGNHICTCGSYHECENCGGAGQIKRIVQVVIGNAVFNPAFLRKIATLPMARIHATQSDKDPCAFCFTGGLGYIMPMKKEVEK